MLATQDKEYFANLKKREERAAARNAAYAVARESKHNSVQHVAQWDEIKKLWPTLTSVEAKLLLSQKYLRNSGFYNEIAPITTTQVKFLSEKLSALGQSAPQRDQQILEERAGAPVTSHPILEDLMFKRLAGQEDSAEFYGRLHELSDKDLAALCKHQKKASCKDGQPVDYVRYALYTLALKKLNWKLLHSLELSELLELDRLVNAGQATEARLRLEGRYALIFRDVPEIFTNTANFQAGLGSAIFSKKNIQRFQKSKATSSIQEGNHAKLKKIFS